MIARLTDDGALDTSFDGDGLLRLPDSRSGPFVAYGLRGGADGKIVVFGVTMSDVVSLVPEGDSSAVAPGRLEWIA